MKIANLLRCILDALRSPAPQIVLSEARCVLNDDGDNEFAQQALEYDPSTKEFTEIGWIGRNGVLTGDVEVADICDCPCPDCDTVAEPTEPDTF